MTELISPSKARTVLKPMIKYGIPVEDISKRTGISTTTIYKQINDMGEMGKKRIQRKSRIFNTLLNHIKSGNPDVLTEFKKDLPCIVYDEEKILQIELLNSLLLSLPSEEVHRITGVSLDLITMQKVNLASEPKYKIVPKRAYKNKEIKTPISQPIVTETFMHVSPVAPKIEPISFAPPKVSPDLDKYAANFTGLPPTEYPYTEFALETSGIIDSLEILMLFPNPGEGTVRKVHQSAGSLSPEILSFYLNYVTPELNRDILYTLTQKDLKINDKTFTRLNLNYVKNNQDQSAKDYNDILNGRLSEEQLNTLPPYYSPSDIRRDDPQHDDETKKLIYHNLLIREAIRELITKLKMTEEKCHSNTNIPLPVIKYHLQMIARKINYRHLTTMDKLPATIAKLKELLSKNKTEDEIYNEMQISRPSIRSLKLFIELTDQHK